MTPALTKISKRIPAARIPVSIPVLTGYMDSSSSFLGMDAESEAKGLGECYAHDLWLNLSSLPFLDSCHSESPLELTEMLFPSLFHNREAYKSALLASPGSLLGLLSVSGNCADSPVLQSRTCDVRLPACEDRRTASENRWSPGPELPRSPKRDVPYWQDKMCPTLDNGTQLACPPGGPPITHHPGINSALEPPLWSLSWLAGVSSPRESVRVGAERCARRQAVLEARASRVTRRIHALLGEHALRHCAGQLQGLGRRLDQQGEHSLEPPQLPSEAASLAGDAPLNAAAVQGGGGTSGGRPGGTPMGGNPCGAQLKGDVWSLVRCGQAVLHRVQEALDSDATESSSDEEEELEEGSGSITASGCLSCEWSWRCERASLASSWAWLQFRLSELDLQIQQVGELHQNILSNKASVVLADSQPLTDRQIQQTLLRETAGLTFTAGRARPQSPQSPPPDNEPCSPTRLLRNIERQSAQLNLMVNSLMAPLSTSPSSSPVTKGMCNHWPGQLKRPPNSPLTDVSLHTTSTCLVGQKKRRVCGGRQRPLQEVATCVSARTRPLMTYQKPRLFLMSQSSVRQQTLEIPACPCADCVSCDPVRMCSHPLWSGTADSPPSTAHPVPPLSTGSSVPLCNRAVLCREDWIRWPGAIPPELGYTSPSSRPAEKVSSSLFNCTHQMHTGRHVSHRLGHAHQGASRPSHSRSPKRRLHRQADKDMGLSPPGKLFPGTTEDRVEEMGTYHRSHTLLTPRSQFPVRRRNGESVYSIDNIVIPMSLATCSKVEKLQYKDILTPSWRLVDALPLVQKEDEEEEDTVEVMSDEVFSHRHQACERKETVRWRCWGKGQRYSRSSSGCFARPANVRGDDPVFSVQSSTFSTPTTVLQLHTEDTEVQTPWKRRVFPLSREEEDALRYDEDDDKAQALWSERHKLKSSMSEIRGENRVASPCYSHTTPPAGCAGKDAHTVQNRLM